MTYIKCHPLSDLYLHTVIVEYNTLEPFIHSYTT